MSLTLGIHDGTHDAGAALLRDGDLIFTAAEEHYSRKKGAGGWPTAAVAACLEQADAPITEVAFPGFWNPNPGLRMSRFLQSRFHLDGGAFWKEKTDVVSGVSQWLQFESAFPRLTSEHWSVRASAPLLRHRLRQKLEGKPRIRLFDHHLCHAASAYFSQPADRVLVLVVDGIGDGLTLSVYQGEKKKLQRLDRWPYPHSYGLLYATITGFLGFRPFRHEGKLTGLAALGNPDAIDLPFPFEGPPESRRFTQSFGRKLRPWLEQLRGHRREDVCAWLQRGMEEELSGVLRYWLRKTGNQQVALAGGVVANVRLNQRLSEVEGLGSLWVFPQMGDAGLAAGAGWLTAAQPRPMSAAFLGHCPTENQITTAMGSRRREILQETEVSTRLAAGQLIARYAGAMEYGPRALGNRSILAACVDSGVNGRLNNALSRSDFMPFAPVLLAEDADAWVEGLGPLRESARYMTTTVQAKPAFRARCPAVVHADGSLRPQLVAAGEPLYPLLKAYRDLTGVPALLNTSFNLHEEPIVRTPEEAIRTFEAAQLDALILGNHLVTA